MGGATFPTYVKLKPGKPIDAVLINGSECEPYLTADHRIMLEYADDIVFGLRAMMKAVSAPEGVILIEDNKPDAVALMEEKVAPYDNIRVVAAKTQYPEGAEKMLIKKVMGRQVPSGKLPADVGCVVSNTSTAKAISDAIQKGMPLVERAVSVTGDFIRNPGNYMVKLGTNVQEIIDHCGGVTGEDIVLKMGGPMMGAPINDTNVPIIKGSNGIIAIAADHTEEKRVHQVRPMRRRLSYGAEALGILQSTASWATRRSFCLSTSWTASPASAASTSARPRFLWYRKSTPPRVWSCPC